MHDMFAYLVGRYETLGYTDYSTQDAGHSALDTRHWTLDTRHWTLDTRH